MTTATQWLESVGRRARTVLLSNSLGRLYTLQLPLVLAAFDGVSGTLNAMPTQSLAATLHSIFSIFATEAIFFVLPAAILIASACIWGPRNGPLRVLFLVGAVALATLVDVMLMQYHVSSEFLNWTLWRELISNGMTVATSATLVTAAYEFHRRSILTAAEFQRDGVTRALMDTERDRARLQTLRAQIEPHFLFNTLANVRRLYQLDRVAGGEMLDNLLRYLESALPRMREDESTLAEEATLIDAYLNIQRIRMDRRLAFEIIIPAELAEQRVPTMMLLTLIENSIKHGLDPLPEGGFLRVSAQTCSDGIELKVADSGRGIGTGTGSGTGTGLANIRARLAALHGSAARLSLSVNQPRGVTARIVLPVSAS